MQTVGRCDRGGTRTNRIKVKAVIVEMSCSLMARPDETLGAICFNTGQDELIEELFCIKCDANFGLLRCTEKARLIIRSIESCKAKKDGLFCFEPYMTLTLMGISR